MILVLLLPGSPHPLLWRPAREEEGVQVLEEGGGVEVREPTTRELVYSKRE
jgi:hypothetical protein